jgi:hypothetical protein
MLYQKSGTDTVIHNVRNLNARRCDGATAPL